MIQLSLNAFVGSLSTAGGLLLTLVYFILVIALVVVPHELGHFFMAVRSGIRPLEFGIGLPPRIAAFGRGKTVFSINLLPIGGFVRVAGMNPESESEDAPYPPEESYTSKGAAAKLLTILGGPVTNILFAFVLLFVVFFSVGSPTGLSREIGSIVPGSEAEKAGIRVGDRVEALNGERVSRIEDAIAIIHNSTGKKLAFSVDRNGTRLVFRVVPRYEPRLKAGVIGFSPKVVYERLGPLRALWLSAEQTLVMTALTLYTVWMLFTGRASLGDLAGPVGIAQITGQAAQNGFAALLGFAAFFSVNLGVINLLPFPALDGGRILFIVIEAIRRRPLDQRTENRIHYAGMVVLLALIAVLTYNDIIRWVASFRR